MSFKSFVDYLKENVVKFPKTKEDHPREITGDDVENAWATKIKAAKDDKISYQHNGVTIHHSDGKHTFILGGHKPLFDRDSNGKLQWKKDLKGATTAHKMPTRDAKKDNVVSLKKEEVEDVDETYNGPLGDKLIARSHAAFRAGDKDTSSRAHKLAMKAGERWRKNPENNRKAIDHIMSGASQDYNSGKRWTGD